MNKKSFIITILLCFTIKVHCMAITGSPLTKYDPCGLGVLYFDKLSEHVWQGVMDFESYKNLSDIYIDITFDMPLVLFGASQNTSVSIENGNQTFTIRPRGLLISPYQFYVSLNETGIPKVVNLAINDVILCNETVKATHTMDSLNVNRTLNDKAYVAHMCGRRSLNFTEVYSVQTEAQAGEWPWHVAIFVEYNATWWKYECGGNIISSTTILTAGHCFSKKGVLVDTNKIVIMAGVNNYSDPNQVGRQVFRAEKVILHPSYTDDLSTADLLILKVNRIEYTEYVQPICIWGPMYNKTELFGKRATIVGFGAREDNTFSGLLRSAYTVVQNDSVCIDDSPMVYTRLMTEFTMCVGFGPNSANNPRNGDSGGGLIMPYVQSDNKVSWFLRGVLSKCGVAPGMESLCDPHYPVVYTDVGPHYSWIYHHSDLIFDTPNTIYTVINKNS